MAKYKAYPEYKDSGVEWLGEVPTHWDCTALKRLCSLITGLTPPTQNEDNYADEGYPWVRPEDLNESGFGTHASKYVSDIGWKLLRHIKPNSTLICCIGTIGKCGYVKETVSTNQQITAATFRDCERFNYYLLQAARAQLEELATGNVLKILNSERLGALNVVKVNRKEANTIAEFLDFETAKIDNLIEKQQQLIELLKEKRQAVISHAVTKGLTPDVPMKHSGVEWLGIVPEHWKIIKGGYIGRLFGSESVSESNISDEGGLPFIKVSTLSLDSFALNQPEWFIKTPHEKSYKSECDYIAFPKRGAAIFTNKVNVVRMKSIIDPNLMGWKMNLGVSDEYIAFVIKKRGLSDIADVSTVPQINNKHIAPEKFPLPPYKEQLEIVDYLKVAIYKFDKVIDTALKAIEFSQERRTALISAAVTGKIDVRDWVAPEKQEVEEPQETTA